MTNKKLPLWQTRDSMALICSVSLFVISFFHGFIAQADNPYFGSDCNQHNPQSQHQCQCQQCQQYSFNQQKFRASEAEREQVEAQRLDVLALQKTYNFQHALVFLGSYWSTSRTEGYTTASQIGSINMTEAGGYKLNLSEGFVLKQPQSDTIALKTFWNPTTLDNATVASKKMQRYLLKSGYIQVMDHHKPLIEGYVFAKKKPGTVALNLYWSPKNQDYYSTTRFSEATAAHEQYELVSHEGYIYPSTK